MVLCSDTPQHIKYYTDAWLLYYDYLDYAGNKLDTTGYCLHKGHC